MASVKLRNPNFYDDALPDVCMKCGAQAVVYKAKTFSWHPGWVYLLVFVGLLPAVIVALILTKRVRLRVPLCERDRNHWLWRTGGLLASFLALVILGCLAATALVEQGPRGGRAGDLFGFVCIAVVGGLVAWVIAAAVVSATTIRATEITDRSITLAGVSRAFADAYYEGDQRSFARDVERTVRERWREDRSEPRPDDDRIREDDPEQRRSKERFREEED
jgi:hypothetical protein